MKSVNEAAHPLCQAGQPWALLHQMLAAVDRCQHGSDQPAAAAEWNEAIESGFVILAEQSFVFVGSDSEINRAIAAAGIVIHDVADQDQAGTVARIARYGVGVEHHR